MSDWLHWKLRTSALALKAAEYPPTSLIPSLDHSCNGIEDDGEVENTRVLPLVRDFLVQNAAILIVELVDLIDMVWALCHQRAFDQVLGDVSQIVVGGELFNVLDQLRLGDASERVLDSVMVRTARSEQRRELTLP